MKTFKIILILLLTTQMLSAQNYFYYYKGEKITLNVSTKKFFIKYVDSLSADQKKQVIMSDFSLKPCKKQIIEASPNVVITDLVEGTTQTQVKELITRLNKNKNVFISSPVFMYKDSSLEGLTENFIVKLKSPFDYSKLQRLAKETNTKIIKQNQFEPSVYILQADKNSKGNAMEMANYFYEQNIFEFAEPDFLFLNAVQTNDPYFSDQWSLENTGQYNGVPGADMNVVNAWTITMGRPDIHVAVVDEGVDLVHPDLANNLLPGYDATGQGSNGAPSGNDAHGTACAGIIAAEANNGIGIAGVCPNCKILPVRAIINDSPTATWLSDGINWAWQNGADVISCSWRFNPSSLIDDAINNALTNGRSGLGCVVLFASGNDNNSSIDYPANLPGVIAVGAMNECNERKNPSSHCDGENWGSNYGAGLGVVAPGVNIATTDISGPAGYSAVPPSSNTIMYNDDYIKNFGGTSAACPNAAGVCALILSVNPCLTQSQVTQILELSCFKAGIYCYVPNSYYPNGAWNNEMGYGRVDAYNAVQWAFGTQINSYYHISGTDQGANDCNGGNPCEWIFLGDCSGHIAAATYFVYQHRVEANVTYPYTPGATILGISNGFSASNPNGGNYFMGEYNITSTSATLYAFTYEITDELGQDVGWVPTTPQNIRFNYSVLSTMGKDLYFQDQNETGTEVYNAMDEIDAGENVTTAVPVGDYVVKSGANVTFHAGNKIVLSNGFHAEAGSTFDAKVEPFFTCTQYPMGKMANPNGDNSNYPPVIKDYEVTKIKDTVTANNSENNLIRNFPNPFSNSTTIEYRIKESQSVRITISDQYGREFIVLQNKIKQEAGTYQVKFSGINIPSGIYYCTLQADNFKATKQLMKID